MSLTEVAQLAIDEIQQKSQKEIYRNDYHAWRHDILGYRSYELMNKITWETLHGKLTKTAVASANGTTKSWEMSCMIAWACTVFEPGDARVIVTAPSLPQIEQVIWAYLKNHFGEAAARGFNLPGRLSEKLEWVYDSDQGKMFLATGRVPAKGKEMAVFQGIRGVKGKVFVFSDEGGAIGRDMFTAMEAVTTGSESRSVIYGNPDYPQAYWRRFWDKSKPEGRTWNTFNISGFDLPTMTGEVVYPDDAEMNARFLSAITSREWIENKAQIWQPNEARYLSKVMGQFPGDDDSSFFPQMVMDKAYDTVIEEDLNVPAVMGVDVARFGQDQSVIAVNRGGRVRVVDAWGKTPVNESARRVHLYAQANAVSEVRVDISGVGGGLYDNLYGEPEFANKNYVLVGWNNSFAAPDKAQHYNLRAYSYDSVRTQMQNGDLDFDYADEELREEMQATTYRFSRGGDGAIQITPKDEIKKGLGERSPDRLDAVVMASTDMFPWTGNPLNALSHGDVVVLDPGDIFIPDMYADRVEF